MVSEDLLSLLKSWKETGVTQIETSTPGYLESMSLVQIGCYSNRPAHCIGSPRTRSGWGGEASGQGIFAKLAQNLSFFFKPLRHLTSPDGETGLDSLLYSNV